MMFTQVIAALFTVTLSVASLAAEASFLKPNDVVAFVGGEDMVAMSEYGYLELFLTRALPEYRLRFRCLAWEGDTVFEQRRDLNYPTLEQHLDKIGATVVIAQFGQMESFAGDEGVPQFVTAYEKLLDRVSGEGKRRVMIVAPTGFEVTRSTPSHLLHVEITKYRDAVEELAKRRHANFTYPVALQLIFGDVPCASPDTPLREHPSATRDWVHLTPDSLFILAREIAENVSDRHEKIAQASKESAVRQQETLRQRIVVKNRLWFNYTRPQNWAFLAGDRTSQPSSRDYRDPNKRWFPGELEQFLPLIETKDAEIWELAKP
jgi:hypothetical protein